MGPCCRVLIPPFGLSLQVWRTHLDLGTIVKKECKPQIEKAEELRQSAAAFAIDLTGASADGDGEQSSSVRLRSSVKAEAGSGAASKRRRAEAEAEAEEAEEADQAEQAEPAAALMQLAGLAAEAVPAAEDVSAAEAVEGTDGEDCCAICTDPLVVDLFTCGECEQAVHRACLMKQVLTLRSQRCVCVLPGLCSCRPAPTCPLCRAGLPPSISGRVRKCGTRGCTLRGGHGGLCSSAPPVSTDAHNRTRRSMQHASATEATE